MPYQPLSSLQFSLTPKTMGATATSPQNSLSTPSNTIPPKLTATTKPGLQSNNISGNSTNTSTSSTLGGTTGGYYGNLLKSVGNMAFPNAQSPVFGSTTKPAPLSPTNTPSTPNVPAPATASTTAPKVTGTPTTSTTPSTTNTATVSTPNAQGQFSGGQTMPSVGTAGYTAAQNLSAPAAPTTNTTPTAPTNVGGGLYGQYIGQLAGTATNPNNQFSTLSGQAQQAYQNAGNTNQIIGRSEQDALHNPNYSLDTGIGRAGQIASNYGLQGQNALTQAQGLTSLAGAANTQQGLQQSGLTLAAGLAAPTTQFGVLTNPVTGEPINGQSATQAAIQGGTIQGLQSGAQTAAATQGGIQSQQSQTVAGYKSAQQQGQNLASQLNDLITTFGLNPNDVNLANAGLQKIAQNVSDPRYKQLNNYINDIANTYSQILTPPGGSATDTSRGIASSMLDATASGTSILSTIQQLDNAANAKIAGVPTTGGTPGGTSSSSNSSWPGWNPQ